MGENKNMGGGSGSSQGGSKPDEQGRDPGSGSMGSTTDRTSEKDRDRGSSGSGDLSE